MQWKIVYTLATGICTAVNSRDPQDGEGVLYLDPTQCAWANVYPERYRVDNGALVERPEWAEEEAIKEEYYRQVAQARQVFDVESEAPVVTPFGTFNGGQDSAGYIQGAVGLAQAVGETEVIITDIDNKPVTLSFADALQVAAMVGLQFRAAFFKKQEALVQAEALRNSI